MEDRSNAFLHPDREVGPPSIEQLSNLFNAMSDTPSNENAPSPEAAELQNRRLFLQGMGKWSGAAIAAVVGTVIGTGTEAQPGSWINRRGGGGGWINRRGGGGSWINGRGIGGWINGRY